MPEDTVYPAQMEGIIDLGLRHFILPRNFNTYFIWWHDCPIPNHIAWHWIGNNTPDVSGHIVTQLDPLSILQSLICEDCGDHGHITNGVWVPVI